VRRRAESLSRILKTVAWQGNDAEGSRCTVIRFAWVVQDNAVGLLHGYRVVPVGKEGSAKSWKKLLVGLVNLLPDRVRNTTWARG